MEHNAIPDLKKYSRFIFSVGGSEWVIFDLRWVWITNPSGFDECICHSFRNKFLSIQNTIQIFMGSSPGLSLDCYDKGSNNFIRSVVAAYFPPLKEDSLPHTVDLPKTFGFFMDFIFDLPSNVEILSQQGCFFHHLCRTAVSDIFLYTIYSCMLYILNLSIYLWISISL